ncbi:hypothetical protein [Aromatoleum evansii]|uniref:hypothetical protein n=1 Tax=Aromatoleum evansii TaxID=59406 RepID=UPI00145E1213|nr:hypothetical protein [Aromatoleum evansii]NMG31837.1 hypothetical protein [Aromatoleum evansii]
MPRVEYTPSDLWVKDCLERLFWIEIAKRKARLVQRDTFSGLLELRQALDAFFERFQTELDEPFDEGADVFFDLVQFDCRVTDAVSEPEHVDLLDKAVKRFGRRAQWVNDDLVYLKGFRLADFSVVTDLEALHGWWSYIISSQGRNELGAKGKFSSIGESRPVAATEELRFAGEESPTIRIGEFVDTVTSLADPVRFPIRVPARQVWAYSTDDHEITIDGHLLRDRVVLDFDLLKPLPSMRQIELAIRTAHDAARARRCLEMLHAGILPDDLHSDRGADGPPAIFDLIYEPPENHQLMVAYNCVRPMVFGLFCWDLVAEGMTDAQAGAHAAKTLAGIDGVAAFTARQAIRGLKDVVRQRVLAYEPTQLPWNS